MANFVATAYDEDGNPTDGYYEDDAGTNYSNEGRNDAATLNEYGQWISPEGAWLRDATDDEIAQSNPKPGDENYSHEGRIGPGNYTDDNQSDAETRRLAGMNSGERGLGNITPGHETPAVGDESTWDKIATSLKLKNPDGSYDWAKVLAVTGLGVSTVGAMTQTPEKQKSIAELRAGMPAMNATQAFTPETLAMMERPMQTGSALQRVYAADMPSPIVRGQTTKGYAEGGEIEGALTQAFEGAVMGDAGGQSDLVEARLSPGEYVMDAESVSALGDGNTAAGIAKLDELRAQLRAQKRSAPNDEIPQQAQGPLSYMQGA